MYYIVYTTDDPCQDCQRLFDPLCPLLCLTKMCRLLAQLVRTTAGRNSLHPFSGVKLNCLEGLLVIWSMLFDFMAHGESGGVEGWGGGGSSLVFAQALVSLLYLVPGPVKTVWAENWGVLQVSIINLNLEYHIFSTCSICRHWLKMLMTYHTAQC